MRLSREEGRGEVGAIHCLPGESSLEYQLTDGCSLIDAGKRRIVFRGQRCSRIGAGEWQLQVLRQRQLRKSRNSMYRYKIVLNLRCRQMHQLGFCVHCETLRRCTLRRARWLTDNLVAALTPMVSDDTADRVIHRVSVQH